MKYVAFLTIVIFFGEPVCCEVPIRQRVVDLIILNDGTRLLGAVMSDERGKDLQILLRGSWLEQNAPELLRSIVPADQKSAEDKSLALLVRDYVTKLKAEPNSRFEKIGYLEERLIDLEGDLPADNIGTPDLLIVSIPSRIVSRRLIQNSPEQNFAGLGILNRIARVEELSKAAVIAELQKIPAASLLRQVPGQSATNASGHQPTAEHELQKLLVKTDRVIGKTCRLIHQSGQYVSEKDASAADLQALTARMMAGQVQAQLQNLLSEDFTKPAGSNMTSAGSVLKKILEPAAASIANSQKADVVEIAEMTMNVAAGSADVRIGLYYQLPDQQQWTLVASVSGHATSKDVSADQQQRIAEDPAVRQITQMFSGLGSNSSSISNAVSIGAAVEVAQQRAKQALEDALTTNPGAAQAGLTVLRGSIPLPPKPKQGLRPTP